MVYLAHKNQNTGSEQPLASHLSATAERAAAFAGVFGAGEAGRFCGGLHDAGKYQAAFQRRIRGSKERVDHSTPGAQAALRDFGDAAAAYCIAGHHGGLPDGGSRKTDHAQDATFWGRMKRDVGDIRIYKQELALQPAEPPAWALKDGQSLFFYIRMLFSALVDADYLDTEAFMQAGAVGRGGGESLQTLMDKLEKHIAPWWEPKSLLNERRCDILRALMAAGESARGLFSLTVPTGGGKTVASMAFALRHALNNGMRRVIYVIPYVSIIEQTQAVFAKIFGEQNVVAHYANVEYAAPEDGAEADPRYLAAENWDAPIILTTAVQFFESLYGNKPSRCRKLHNIANSVLVFDEAQMLPVHYLTPCVSAIAQLVGHYRCSAVLCTATQPSLCPLFETMLPEYPIRELCPQNYAADPVFTRASFQRAGTLSEEELARRLLQEKQALCVVNTKRQAQRLFALLGEGNRFHLSTAMTPKDRRDALQRIQALLNDKQPCRVVSTSLIEAGVDVDFPVVYRALAGLDSIIQAGGRCNRNGKGDAAASFVYVFDTPERPPQSMRQNIAAAEYALRDAQIASPGAIKAYFDFFYYKLKGDGQLDKKSILAAIDSNTMPFASIAASFKLIENADCTVYIPQGEGKALTEELVRRGPSRSLARKLGQYAVGVHAGNFENLAAMGAVVKTSENAGVLRDTQLYNSQTGLSLDMVEGKAIMV